MGSSTGTASGTGLGQKSTETTGTMVSGTNDTAVIAAGGIGSITGARSDSASRGAVVGPGSDMDDQANLQPAKPAVELKLSGTYLEMRNKMEGLSGTAFDRQYVQQAQKDHNLSIRLLEAYQKTGKNAQLKSWVKEQLSVIRMNRAEWDKLSASVGGAKRSKK